MRVPDLLQHVTLVAHRDLGSQLLDVEVDGDTVTLVLSRVPEHLEVDRAPGPLVVWTGTTGRYECPVDVRRDRRDYGPVWLARPTGPVVRHQRRAHFRAPLQLAVTLSWTGDRDDDAEDAGERTVSAIAADLSEGGLLATVRTGAPPVGATVGVAVTVDGEALDLPATVVRHTAYDGGACGVALAFTAPEVHGDRLRRAAFEAERRVAAAARR